MAHTHTQGQSSFSFSKYLFSRVILCTQHAILDLYLETKNSNRLSTCQKLDQNSDKNKRKKNAPPLCNAMTLWDWRDTTCSTLIDIKCRETTSTIVLMRRRLTTSFSLITTPSSCWRLRRREKTSQMMRTWVSDSRPSLFFFLNNFLSNLRGMTATAMETGKAIAFEMDET